MGRGSPDTSYATFEGFWPSLLSGRNLAGSPRKVKVMFVARHIDEEPLEAYPLGFQKESLFKAKFARQRDAASSAQDTLPGQTGYLVQHLGDVAGAARIAGGLGDGTVGTDPPAGNPPDHGCDGGGKWRFVGRQRLHRSR